MDGETDEWSAFFSILRTFKKYVDCGINQDTRFLEQRVSQTLLSILNCISLQTVIEINKEQGFHNLVAFRASSLSLSCPESAVSRAESNGLLPRPLPSMINKCLCLLGVQRSLFKKQIQVGQNTLVISSNVPSTDHHATEPPRKT